MRDANSTPNKYQFIFLYTWSLRESEIVAFENAINNIGNFKIINISKDFFNIFIDNNQIISNEEKIGIFWKNFIERNSDAYKNNPEIFSNKFLSFQFDAIRDEIHSSLTYLDIFLSFINFFNPVLICFGHEAFTFERSLVRLANLKKIPTVSFYHDGLGPEISHKGNFGESKYIFVWNDIQRNLLISFGAPKKNIISLGSIRYEDKFYKFLSQLSIEKNIKPKKVIKKLCLDKNKPIITILTAPLSIAFALPTAHPTKHRAAFRGLLDLIKRRNDLQFIIKPHPGADYYDLYKLFAKYNLPNLRVVRDRELDYILSVTDVCVAINSLTTAVLEAMLSQKPIIYFNNASYSLVNWNDSLRKRDLVRSNTIRMLEKSIDNLLFAKFLISSNTNNVDLIKKILGFTKGSASGRLREALLKIINKPKASISYKRNVKAPKYLLKNFPRNEITINSNINLYEKLTYFYKYGYFKLGFLKAIKELKVNEVKKLTIRKLLYIYIIGYISNKEETFMFDKLRLSIMICISIFFFISCPRNLKKEIIKYLIR